MTSRKLKTAIRSLPFRSDPPDESTTNWLGCLVVLLPGLPCTVGLGVLIWKTFFAQRRLHRCYGDEFSLVLKHI